MFLNSKGCYGFCKQLTLAQHCKQVRNLCTKFITKIPVIKSGFSAKILLYLLQNDLFTIECSIEINTIALNGVSFDISTE